MEDVPAFKYPKHTSNRKRHLVEDAGIAKAYLKYWTLLRDDPERSVARDAVMDLTPNPTDTPATCVFSPRSSAAMRKWYGPRIRNARNCVLFTGAFGIDPVLLEALADKGPALRFISLERPPDRIGERSEEHIVSVRHLGSIPLAWAILMMSSVARSDFRFPPATDVSARPRQ